MNFVVLKLTLEILSMKISKHTYIYGRYLFPTFYLITNGIFDCFKTSQFTTQILNNPLSNVFNVTYRQLCNICSLRLRIPLKDLCCKHVGVCVCVCVLCFFFFWFFFFVVVVVFCCCCCVFFCLFVCFFICLCFFFFFFFLFSYKHIKSYLSLDHCDAKSLISTIF